MSSVVPALIETELVPLSHQGPARPAPLPVPWRDPHEVSKAEIAQHIARLEEACLAFPQDPGLRTCLGMAYAMNLDVYQSMDALDAARELDPSHFWAQVKYAELHYRLRALAKAKEETLKALNLATTPFEAGVARRQLTEIRRLMREGTQKPAWTKPLRSPSLALAGVAVVVCLWMAWQ